jgi:hypothetical protein
MLAGGDPFPPASLLLDALADERHLGQGADEK